MFIFHLPILQSGSGARVGVGVSDRNTLGNMPALIVIFVVGGGDGRGSYLKKCLPLFIYLFKLFIFLFIYSFSVEWLLEQTRIEKILAYSAAHEVN